MAARVRTAVDPRFPAELARLRRERGLSLRALAAEVYQGKTLLHELETGQARPTVDIAARLDEALDAGGRLSGMVRDGTAGLGPDDAERLLYAARNPRRIDPTAVDSLAAVLSHQRRLEDVAGSAAMVTPALAQVALAEHLVAGAADDDGRAALVDVAAQWAHFAGWLCATTGDHRQGHRWYVRAMEWATEVGNPHMVATALSMRGHLAWVRGQTRAMVALSQAAAWQPASRGVRALAIQQEARGLALLGDGPGCDDRLDRAEDLAVAATDHPEREPDWMYFYDPAFFRLQRGLAQHYLGRHDRAAELLASGLNELPADIRESDWIGWYVCQLAAAHAAAGNADCAADRLTEAARVAEATGAARLAGEVAELERTLVP